MLHIFSHIKSYKIHFNGNSMQKSCSLNDSTLTIIIIIIIIFFKQQTCTFSIENSNLLLRLTCFSSFLVCFRRTHAINSAKFQISNKLFVQFSRFTMKSNFFVSARITDSNFSIRCMQMSISCFSF